MSRKAMEAIEAARQRRADTERAKVNRFEENFRSVVDVVAMKMRDRVRTAAEYLRSKVVVNISRPVTKTPTKRIRTVTRNGVTRRKSSQYTKVTDRSVKGEFPKADTTLGMKGIILDCKESSPGVFDGSVGTPTDYMAVLEISESLDRKFLTRTLSEERDVLIQTLSGPLQL